jgi:hypothetical protein
MDGPDEGLVPEPIRPATLRRGPEPALIVAIALLLTIGALVVKPWAIVGQLTSSAIGSPPGTSSGQAAIGASPSGSAPVTSETATPGIASPGITPPAATPTYAPDAYVENLPPIEPDSWMHISASLRLIDRAAVVFVARWPGGLYWRFVPVTPGARDSLAESPATTGGDAVAPTDTVRMTGFLANPVAIGLVRPSGEPEPEVLAWQILGPGASFRLPVRHPVGDLDRFLFLGPGLGLPRGEQRNRREISRFPPTWLEGVYRFDLTNGDGTEHVFVVLEPEASS